ncbi:MAG: hypothetical protein M1315_00395 [Candidatus Thermoplasmatota archaeon]|nr:hypothetical protein [Candidatus Thermoplasmatota archaeon]
MQNEVSASEISEYEYCSVAWYMDKNGYRRSGVSSTRMISGTQMHRSAGITYRRSVSWSKVGTVGALIAGAVLIFLMLRVI